MSSYAALADWEGYLEWKNHNASWCLDSNQPGGVDQLEFFDKNIPLQWPEKKQQAKVEWSVDSLMDEAKNSMLMAADRIRSSRSIHTSPDCAWKIMQFLTRSNLELGYLSTNDVVSPCLPICHALSHKNDSAYQWMEHLRAVLRGASCTQLPFSQSRCSLEWSRWLHWYVNLDNQSADIADIHLRTDLATVALACQEGNLALAERQLRSRLSSQGHDLPTLLMNDVLKMKLTASTSASHQVQIQFQGAKLLHQ